MVIRLEQIDTENEQLKWFIGSNEIQLLRYYEPEPGIFITESPNVIRRAIADGYEPVVFLCEERALTDENLALVQQFPDIPSYAADLSEIKRYTEYSITKGMLCAMRRRTLAGPEEICRAATRIVVMENVTNPTNLGAIFRSAAALGMDAVLLTHDCTDPLYRRASRVSMGTVFQIPWAWIDSREDTVSYLHQLGFKAVSMALRKDTISIDDARLKQEEKLAVLMGNESHGLTEQTIDASDYTVKIPMMHGVDSLNVAAASAVAFWELGSRRQ